MSAGKSPGKTYSDQEIEARLKSDLPHWHFRDGCICRKYQTSGWKGTLMVINAVGHLAEAAWHHPDLSASYNSVEVRLQSHDAKGITDRDFELAKKIEEFVHWQPGKEGGPFTGTPQDPRYAYIKYDG
ncbi:MAG: 4a-hydroxytetrahydrobiopterin dehydratase [Rhodomicrobium sp.]|nr:4a-hydroxytetrahydrobiopterin dehydratase [Rhodomicrobium sp.]